MLGYAVEMSLANLLKTPYPFSYSQRVLSRFSSADISSITKSLCPLLKHPVLQQPFIYTGANLGYADFISTTDSARPPPQTTYKPHILSVKSNYKTSMICPQKIGQTTKGRFVEFLGIPKSLETDDIKWHIESNINELLVSIIYFWFCVNRCSF